MPQRPSQRYTARALAELAGTSERTVRYYVREGLIDPPTGRGPGAHFDDRHLSQLRRVRLLQEAGLDHAAIRQYGTELQAVLAKRGVRLREVEGSWANFALQARKAYHRLSGGASRTPDISNVTRVAVARGIALEVDGTRRLPPPARLAELTRLIRAAFNVNDAEDGDDD